MKLFLNIIILFLSAIAIAVLTWYGLYTADQPSKDRSDVAANIATAIAFSTWIGTMIFVVDDLVKTLEKLICGCSKEDREDGSRRVGESREEICCGCSCRQKMKCEIPNSWTDCWSRIRENCEIFEKSKWPLLIHFLLLLTAIVLCSLVFFLNLQAYMFRSAKGVSGTTINVYGMGEAIVNGDPKNTTLWSAADIAIPDVENVVSFITTKRVTVHQTVGRCGESRSIQEAHCRTDSDCAKGEIYRLGNGIATGNCLNGTCEVRAWCPIDPAENDDEVTVEELDGKGKYFLHVINHVHFDIKGGKWRNNSVENSSCVFKKNETPPCPVLSVDYIIQEAMKSNQEITEFPEDGTTISIQLKYECNFDEDTCFPKYSFTQLHSKPAHLADYDSSAITYPYRSTSSRVYLKTTGILFLVEVDASMRYRSNSQLLGSAAAAFASVKTTKPLAQMLTMLFGTVAGFILLSDRCSKSKWCCQPTSEQEGLLTSTNA